MVDRLVSSIKSLDVVKSSPALDVTLTLDENIFPAQSAHQSYLIHLRRPSDHDLHDKIALAEIYHQPEIENRRLAVRGFHSMARHIVKKG
jgi:hypothetical protein